MTGVYAVLLAAGSGTRMGMSQNKMLLRLGGRSVVLCALKALAESRIFEKIFVVVKDTEREKMQQCLSASGILYELVCGGKERQDSVKNALDTLPCDAEVVAIHDAARCFTSPVLIRECVQSALAFGSGVAGRYVQDTVKMVDGRDITGTLNRENLVLIETPQAFRVALIKKAYAQAYEDNFYGTDDAMLVERMGERPRLVVSESVNIKLTRPADVAFGEFLMEKRLISCVGQGFDAHRFIKGRPLILGGVAIEYPLGLEGHSDADVLVHAVIDALLGACGLADIGEQFPDTDRAYHNIRSIELLRRVGAMLKQKGAQIQNIDVTVIMQRPAIAPYRERMCNNLACALELDRACISIKATTTEKMGFCGREEGAAAQAVCLVHRYTDNESKIQDEFGY